MGQAKQRGSFAERQAKAIKKKFDARQDRVAIESERLKNMSPEERGKLFRTRVLMAAAIGHTLMVKPPKPPLIKPPARKFK